MTTVMQQYAHEFVAAIDRADRLGIEAPVARIVATRNCIDMSKVQPVLQRYFAQYSAREMLGQAFAINVQLLPLLSDALRVPLTLTFGWFDDHGKQLYKHDEVLLRTLIANASNGVQPGGYPFHVWITSPAWEVLDVTLPTTLSSISGNKELEGRIIYLAQETSLPSIIYHPTIVGEEFLFKIGAAVPLSTDNPNRRHA